MLNETRECHAPLGWLAKKVKRNAWWDADAFVDNLRDADNDLQGKVPALRHRIDVMRKQTKRNKLGLQAAASQCLKMALHPCDLAAEACRRILLWAGPICSSSVLYSGAQKTIEAARDLPPFFGTALIRTWFNGWATSYRMHATAMCAVCGLEGGERKEE